MFIKILRHYDPGTKGSGGPGLSLAEIEADQDTNPAPEERVTPEDPEIDPNETDEEKEERLEKEKQDKEDAEQVKLEAAETKAEEKAEAARKKQEDADAAEAAKNPPADDPDDTVAFWTDVDTLRGEKLGVDFGDIDPLSPEGILIYEKAVRDNEMQTFDGYMEKVHPKVYAMMEHVLNGGKYEDFLEKVGSAFSLPSEQELENSQELQKQVLEMNLRAKGLDDKKVDALIKASVAGDSLEEDSKVALKEEQDKDVAKVKAARDATQQVTSLRDQNIKEMSDFIQDVVNTGEVGGLVIPEKDRAGFAQELRKSIRYADGKFMMTTELTQENVDAIFRKEFFGYKGGKLKELVEKQARTENTNRLRRSVGTKETPKGSSASGATITTLGDI